MRAWAQSSQDVLIENVFIRSDDDSIAVKGQYPSVDTANLVVRDSVLWNQRFGNCMEIGLCHPLPPKTRGKSALGRVFFMFCRLSCWHSCGRQNC